MVLASASVALDLGPIGLGPTPVAILLAALVVGAVLLLVVLAGSQIGGSWVDRKWPANEPLTPSEVLWAESGAHVAKTFPGLDPSIARDLTQYIVTRKVPAGGAIVEAGELATHFVLLKSGTAQVSGQSGNATVKAGASFGADNIMRRTPYDVDVVAASPCEVVSLGAEDYLAAVALGMSDDDDDYVVQALGGYLDADSEVATPATGDTTPQRGSAASATLAPPAPAPPAAASRLAEPPPPPQRGPRWPEATHVVVAPELPGYLLPAGDHATRVLRQGDEVARVESLPGWHHVRADDGWHGWVIESGLRGI